VSLYFLTKHYQLQSLPAGRAKLQENVSWTFTFSSSELRSRSPSPDMTGVALPQVWLLEVLCLAWSGAQGDHSYKSIWFRPFSGKILHKSRNNTSLDNFFNWRAPCASSYTYFSIQSELPLMNELPVNNKQTI
jgi:hypothetical protein